MIRDLAATSGSCVVSNIVSPCLTRPVMICISCSLLARSRCEVLVHEQDFGLLCQRARQQGQLPLAPA